MIVSISNCNFFFFLHIDIHACARRTYDGFGFWRHRFGADVCLYSFRETLVHISSGDNTEIEGAPDFSEHAYAELSRRPHPLISAANRTTNPTSTLDIAYLPWTLRPLEQTSFRQRSPGRAVHSLLTVCA